MRKKRENSPNVIHPEAVLSIRTSTMKGRNHEDQLRKKKKKTKRKKGLIETLTTMWPTSPDKKGTAGGGGVKKPWGAQRSSE